MPVLGLAGCHWRKTGKLQVRFHRNIAASSLAADCNVPQRPPAKLEVLHLYRWFTHTIFHTQLCQRQSFAHNSFTHNFSHTTLSQTHNFLTQNSPHRKRTFKMIDPPPSPLSFLLSPCHCNHFFWLLEEVDLWGYPVLLFFHFTMPQDSHIPTRPNPHDL